MAADLGALSITENDDYCFIVVPLQDNDSFCWTYSERILTKTCQNEKCLTCRTISKMQNASNMQTFDVP